jgi:hypothetical protein
MTFKVTVAALAAVGALAAGAADAAVIFSNFGPGDDFNRTGFGFNSHSTSTPGMVFTSTADADVSEIVIALANITGANNAVVSLWTKDLTTELGSWTVSVPDRVTNAPYAATTITGISGVHLDAGAQYVLEAGGPGNSYNYWLLNDTGDKGQSTTNVGTNPYITGYTRGAFEILSAVPEPDAWAMMIVGFAGVGATLRRRRIALA